MAAAIALCVKKKGWLDYDKPVVHYWLEFAANGKQVQHVHRVVLLDDNIFLLKNITVSDIILHRPGLPYVDEKLTLDDVCNWSRTTSLLATEKPHWEPGTTHGYHPVTSDFLDGDAVIRCDNRHNCPFDRFVCEELDTKFCVGVSNYEIEACVVDFSFKTIRRKVIRYR
ncbi:unnamed protein product [Rotaria sp. Silwood2]|nr:unnamed protein product [Rotaria sp. Silwood2]